MKNLIGQKRQHTFYEEKILMSLGKQTMWQWWDCLGIDFTIKEGKCLSMRALTNNNQIGGFAIFDDPLYNILRINFHYQMFSVGVIDCRKKLTTKVWVFDFSLSMPSWHVFKSIILMIIVSVMSLRTEIVYQFKWPEHWPTNIILFLVKQARLLWHLLK